jgi:hypothetical protein
MKKRINRISVLVLGMTVMVLSGLAPFSAAIINSTDSGAWVIDSDNNTDNASWSVWHDGRHDDPSGEELFRIQENGNVGIGIQDPQHRLDVAGTIQMTGFKMPTGASAGYVLTSDADGVGTWQPDSGGTGGGLGGIGTVNFLSKFTGSTTLGDSVICEFNDNIGIGTTSPSEKLEVIGNIVVSGTVDGVDIDVAVANLIATDLTLQANLDAEETARIAADIALQSNLDAETAARIAGDVALQANIDAEEAARIAGDIALQNNIDAETAARIAGEVALQANIDAEEAARIAADIALQNNIDAETAARIAGDVALQANIDAEEVARLAADIALQNNIDSEEAARIATDIALQNNIDTEEAARIAADAVLQANIDAEEAARIAGDNTLQANIDAEESARIAGDITLQTNIDNLAAIDALDYDSLADLENAVANGFNIATLSGNVGIGTLSPTAKLDINGNVRVRELTQNDDLNNVVVADANGVLHIRDVNTIGFKTNIITITKDYTPICSDYTILVDASSNDVTIELPKASDALGQVLILKRIDDEKGNEVTIDADGSETIDGDSTIELEVKYMSYSIQSDGSDWYILGSYGFMGRSHIGNDNR